MASLGSLFIELAANTARLQGDLGKAVSIVDKTAAKFKTAFKFAGGGLLGAAFASAAKQAIEFGDSINKASIKSGIGNRAMSELAYAAKLADVDIASLSTAIKKMQVSLSEAGTGAKGPTTALAALGLTVQDLQKRKPEAQFELLADRISKLTDPADRARAAVELFGKAGADLLPLFEQGAAGIAKARAEAEKLGLSFSDEQIKKLSAADDSIKRLDASWKGFATTLTAAVAPALSSVFDTLSGLDTRSVADKIADTEAALRARTMPAQVKEKLLKELSELRGRQELEEVRAAQTGTSGGPTSRGRSASAIGFAAADAAAAAEEAAKKAAAAQLKEDEKLAKEREDLFLHMDEEISEQYYKELDERTEETLKREQEAADLVKENEEKLAAWRKEQQGKLSENAQLFKDSFLNAFDDMVNTGKFKWKELLKYMAAEWTRRGFIKLFDGLFSGNGAGATAGSGGGGIGGWISKGLGALGGLFGGSGGGGGGGMGIVQGEWDWMKKMGGGPWGWLKNTFGGFFADGGRAQANKWIMAGEDGPEPVWTGPAGASVIPNGAGGGISVDARQYVHAPGATMELMKVLPRMLEQNRKATIAEVIDGLRRRRYAV